MPLHRLVILEEQALFRDLLCEVFSHLEGLETAGSGDTIKEGLRLCTEQSVDLIISGWHLRDGTGLELVHALRHLSHGPKVILLSGDELDGVVRDAAQSGIHGFVSKHQPLNVLKDALLAVLSGKCFYCPSSSRMLLEAMREQAPVQPLALTHREREVLKALANGQSTKDMAQQFRLSPKTISNQLTLLKEKLGIHEPAGLVLYAQRHGLVRLQQG